MSELSLGDGSGIVLFSSVDDGRKRGGLFSWDGQSIVRIDDLNTTGLAIGGDRFARVLTGAGGTSAVGEIVIYDKGGVRSYWRVDGIVDAHDLCYDEDSNGWIVVGSGDDSVMWIDPTGTISRTWTAPDRPPGRNGDAWHVNCIAVEEGKVVATAFGENLDAAERKRRIAEPRGFLMELDSQRLVLEGLVTPHHPTRINGSWVICSSSTGTVDQFDDSGNRVASVIVGGWPRGLARVGSCLVVGVSSHRLGAAVGTATLAVIDIATFAEVQRVDVPVREIYDVKLVPAAVADWVAKGWDNNAPRVRSELIARFLEVPCFTRFIDWALKDLRINRTIWAGCRWAANIVLPRHK